MTVLSNDSQEAPTNQRHRRHESVSHDGKADASPGRVWIFETYSDVQSIRPKKRSSCRDEPAGARYAIGASETGRSLLEANRPLAGCFPAEPASVSSGNVISTQDSRERNHWTSEHASKNPLLRQSRSAICVTRSLARRQPESPHSRMVHLAPEFWLTLRPELTDRDTPGSNSWY